MKLNQTSKDDPTQRYVDAEAGDLTVRLAETREEIDAALAAALSDFL